MKVRAVRAGGVACAAAVLAVAGVVLGGRWWVVVLAGMVGALSGRTGALVHAVVTVALAGAAAQADATWLVPLLVLGVVASVESAAVATRPTRVRRQVPSWPALAAPALSAAVAAAVLTISQVAPAATVPTTLAATLGAATLLAATR